MCYTLDMERTYICSTEGCPNEYREITISGFRLWTDPKDTNKCLYGFTIPICMCGYEPQLRVTP